MNIGTLPPFFLLCLFALTGIAANDKIDTLTIQVREDCKKLNIPQKNQIKTVSCVCGTAPLDVAIIGGGMTGSAAAFALIKEGINQILIFDSEKSGLEGSWNHYAKMKQLRSNKEALGPALGIPSLTFRSWYEATRGPNAWNILGYIPTLVWIDYLRWYREALNLPVKNELRLIKITPQSHCFTLTFEGSEGTEIYEARKVVLATGLAGFGGCVTPTFVSNLPKEYYATAYETIDPSHLVGKRVVVVGAGASAFDSTAYALENGAAQVIMMVRRKKIPTVNSFVNFSSLSVKHGFYSLPDEARYRLLANALSNGLGPPRAALDRVSHYPNFQVRVETEIQQITLANDHLLIHTTHDDYEADFLILATGFAIDGSQQPEIAEHMPHILLWRDQAPAIAAQYPPMIGRFPYLGPHFQFLEAEPGSAPYLKNLYCFNYGSFLSHGLITCNIHGLNVGAERLARGIAADFFVDNVDAYFPNCINPPIAID